MYGKDAEWLRAELRKLQRMEAGGKKLGGIEGQDDADGQIVWQGGKISGAVYHGGQDMSDLLADAIKMFMVSNPVSRRSWPSGQVHINLSAKLMGFVSLCLPTSRHE